MALLISMAVRPGGVAWLSVSGDIDLATGDELTTAITDATKTPEVDCVVVDLDQVTFLDSSGIAVLVDGRRTAEANACGYRVVNPHGVVRRVLDVTGVRAFLEGDA